MNGLRDQLHYKSNTIDLTEPARSDDSRDAERRQGRLYHNKNSHDDRNISKVNSLLTRIMQSEQIEKTHEVLLSKRHRARYRKNRLWNKKERNGKVICIKPENCQKRG